MVFTERKRRILSIVSKIPGVNFISQFFLSRPSFDVTEKLLAVLSLISALLLTLGEH